MSFRNSRLNPWNSRPKAGYFLIMFADNPERRKVIAVSTNKEEIFRQLKNYEKQYYDPIQVEDLEGNIPS